MTLGSDNIFVFPANNQIQIIEQHTKQSHTKRHLNMKGWILSHHQIGFP
jgi:hypothetical protein